MLRSLKEVGPSDTYRTNARIRILNTIISPPHHHLPRYLGYTFGTALATVVLSIGTVYAAQSSLPNTPLYPVKVFSEDVALTLSPTKSIKTSVAQTIISRRITEVEAVQEQGDTKAVQASVSHMNEDITSIQKRNDVAQNKIEEEINRHKDFINTVNKNDDGENKHEDQKPSNESHHDD